MDAGDLGIGDAVVPGDARLVPPAIPRGFLFRPRLEQMLDAGAAGRVTVVTAGPGWGKTLVVASWARSRRSDRASSPGPAWLSLDAADNEPRRFWSGVVAALRRAGLARDGNPLAVLDLEPGVSAMDIQLLRRGIAGLRAGSVLVVDDFQVVDDPEILETLDTLLRHESPMHLVLISRTDPNLPLHRLRISDQLLEIRSTDLAFDLAEAGVFLGMNGPRVAASDVVLLVERTEGWATGLRLAAMFLTRDSTPGRAADFAGDDRAVADYLLSEVLHSQTDDMRNFLLRTSITDHICGELADVLLAAEYGQQHLEELERSNTFITALGTNREWYRYHPLLREALAHRLSSQQPVAYREVHRRAAIWFGGHGDGLQAMQHALAAKDWPLMGELFVTVAVPMVLGPERHALDAVLRQIPDSEVTRTAALQVCAVARLEHAGRYPEMVAGMTRAHVLVTTDTSGYAPMTSAVLGLFGLMVARTKGDIPGVLDICAGTLAALDSMPVPFPASTHARAVALSNQGVGLIWTGQPAAAQAVLHPAMAFVTTSGMELSRLNCLGHLGLAAVLLGKLDEAAQWAERGRQLTEERGWMSATQAAASYLAAALVNLTRSRAGEANMVLKQGAMAQHEPTAAVAALIAQTLVNISLGRLNPALRSAEAARNMLEGRDFPEFLTRWVTLAGADAALADGSADQGLAMLSPLLESHPLPATVRTRIALAHLTRGDPVRADDALRGTETVASHIITAVQICVLTSLIADRLHEPDRAMDALQQAVTLATPERVYRPFHALDLGLERRRIRPLLGRLCALHPANLRFVHELDHVGPSAEPLGEDPMPLRDPLTHRELAVLQLLPTMQSNEEIALDLLVSVNTVKAYLKSLYRKLEVPNRRTAVQRGRSLGLIR